MLKPAFLSKSIGRRKLCKVRWPALASGDGQVLGGRANEWRGFTPAPFRCGERRAEVTSVH
jgi:hypothetical protein